MEELRGQVAEQIGCEAFTTSAIAKPTHQRVFCAVQRFKGRDTGLS
jgi:hypothetical protein